MLHPIRDYCNYKNILFTVLILFTVIFFLFPVSGQTQTSALPTPAGVGVATTVHLNPMQLMAVDRIGLQSAQISTQNIQQASMTAQGIQPAPIGVQGLHATAPISTQGMQQVPVAAQQPQPESKPSGRNKQKQPFSLTCFFSIWTESVIILY